MKLGSDTGSVSIDPSPLSLMVALIVRDAAAAGLSIPAASAPPRLELPVADFGLAHVITEAEWLSWWRSLLDDLQSGRAGAPDAHAPELVKPQIFAALAAYGPWQQRVRPPSDPRLGLLGEAAGEVMASDRPLRQDLHVAVLPVADGPPLQLDRVLVVSYRRLSQLDAAGCAALLRDADQATT